MPPDPDVMADGVTADGAMADGGMAVAAGRLAALLTGAVTNPLAVTDPTDPSGAGIVADGDATPRVLRRLAPPVQAWAVDGGQSLVGDARTVSVQATRTATVCWEGGAATVEEAGPLDVHLLGQRTGVGEHRALAGAPVAPDTSVDVNLLRDWAEWQATAAAVARCVAGGFVLVDGDLQPDWRIRASWLADLLAGAAARRVVVAGVTKHSSLARGGAPLVGVLEREAVEALGPRATWWAPVGRTRPDVGGGLQVVVARLDPDARYAFRVDLPGGEDPEAVLGSLSALCDDAAFPGYPYPLTCADRLAACDPWVRHDLWARLSEQLGAAGVDPDVVERAFADRHRLMERW